MTTPTVPPTTEPVEITCQIEIDPLAPPCGTGLEGWGGPLAEPVTICSNGETRQATYAGEHQAAIAGRDGNSLGACPTPEPTVIVTPVAEVAAPQSLPETGAGEVAQVGLAGSLILIGAALLRLAHRTA